MSGKRYTEQFKVEAVKQITEQGQPIGDGTGIDLYVIGPRIREPVH